MRAPGPVRKACARRRGAAIVAVVLAVLMLLAMCGAIMGVTMSGQRERSATIDRLQAQYAAASGVHHAVANLVAGNDADIGAPDDQLSFSEGSYWVDVTPSGTGVWTILSRGFVQAQAEGIEAVVTPAAEGVYESAIFAGNSSGDPLYALDLGGTGGQADAILGNVYSGGGVDVGGDAQVLGEINATGAITGAAGQSGVTQPIPDLAAMDYAHLADFDVKALFAEASYASNDAGGSAWQVPAKNPAHIFRRNPSNRTTETGLTEKEDYFLEDPYEDVGIDEDSDGSDPYVISLVDSTVPYVVGGKPYSGSGNKKVYYIDGNLWLHNYKSFSFMIESTSPEGMQVAFVVKGNIYFSDNLFYDNPTKDGVAFIAMKDAGVKDSGNIYFGDPEFGTLEQMHAFMYAEENFYDVNLAAEGSASVKLYGNMTAGNQVLIERDFEGDHSQLMVDFDERIKDGSLEIPGLPKSKHGGTVHYEIRSWRRVAAR